MHGGKHVPATTPPPYAGLLGFGFGHGCTIGPGASGLGGGGHSGSAGGGGGGHSGKAGGGGGGHSGKAGGGGGGHSGKAGGGGGDGGGVGGGQAISGGGGGGDGKVGQGFSHEVQTVHSSCSLDVVLVVMVNEKLNWNANMKVKKVSSGGLELAIFQKKFWSSFDIEKKIDDGVWFRWKREDVCMCIGGRSIS